VLPLEKMEYRSSKCVTPENGSLRILKKEEGILFVGELSLLRFPAVGRSPTRIQEESEKIECVWQHPTCYMY
jgi:hypothetical protein